MTRIPEGVTRLGNCYETPGYIDCAYESDGVEYLVFEQSLTRKTVAVVRPPERPLPYGLSGDETPQEALARLERYDAQFRIEEGREGHTLVASAANEAGVVVILDFGTDGRLEEITIGGPSV